jgi:plastocyanin
MRILYKQRPGRCALTLSLWVLAACGPSYAAELNVSVLDPAGHGSAGIVLIAEPQFDLAVKRVNHTVIMDQRQKQFVPNILVIQTGTGIDFPNSDQIEHQVYSFSPAKTFQLSLYAGHKYPPIVFDRAGLVVVGCNIHDQMIGYIDVTDSPYFARSDDAGQWTAHDLPPGNYRITAWHPRMQESAPTPLQMSVTVAEGTPSTAVFHLTKPLRPSSEHGGDKRWIDY